MKTESCKHGVTAVNISGTTDVNIYMSCPLCYDEYMHELHPNYNPNGIGVKGMYGYDSLFHSMRDMIHSLNRELDEVAVVYFTAEHNWSIASPKCAFALMSYEYAYPAHILADSTHVVFHDGFFYISY